MFQTLFWWLNEFWKRFSHSLADDETLNLLGICYIWPDISECETGTRNLRTEELVRRVRTFFWWICFCFYINSSFLYIRLSLSWVRPNENDPNKKFWYRWKCPKYNGTMQNRFLNLDNFFNCLAYDDLMVGISDGSNCFW